MVEILDLVCFSVLSKDPLIAAFQGRHGTESHRRTVLISRILQIPPRKDVLAGYWKYFWVPIFLFRMFNNTFLEETKKTLRMTTVILLIRF